MPKQQPTLPTNYPPTSGATEVWEFGNMTSSPYTSVIQSDSYVLGGSNPSVSYGLSGPTGSNMQALGLDNSSGNSTHITAPGTSSGQSSGPVASAMQPGSSDFQLKVYYRHLSGGSDPFYYLMDYDLQDSATVFQAGIQLFYSTQGPFSPGAFGVVLGDGTDTAQYHAFSPNQIGFEDGEWVLLEWSFDRSKNKPDLQVNRVNIMVNKTFQTDPDLKDLGAINPTDGIRWGMREYSEGAAGLANVELVAAAYAKNLTYQW